MNLSEGTELQNGKYRIIRVLGQGGFGITYLATDLRLGRLVAIKEFFPKGMCIRNNDESVTVSTEANAIAIEKLRNRFVKEARNLACLSHPNIVKIFETFEENGTAYYVMEYIEGENLNVLVKRDGPLSESKARRYIGMIGDAVDCIHSHHMTHFDIKPANIMLRISDDTPILIDFGLSKDFGKEDITTMLQAISNGFSPMELYNVSSIQSWSPETDVYSLAATLYFLITGKVPPYAGDLRDDSSLLVIPTNISKPTRRAITNVMTVPRSQRPKSVQTFTDALHGEYNSFNVGGRSGREDNLNDSTRIVDDDINPGYHPNIDNGEDDNGKTGTPKNKSSKVLFWIIGIIVIGLIVFVISGYFIDYSSALSNDNENQSNTEEVIQNQSSVESVTNAGESMTEVPSDINTVEYKRKIRINELLYNADIFATLDNGTLTANVDINGSRGVDIYKYKSNVETSKVLDLYQGLCYYDAACMLASQIVPEEATYGTYNEEFMKPTLNMLKKSAECFSRSRGNDPIAYNGAMSRYNMLKELTPINSKDREDIAIIAWGMSEHPVEPNGLRFVSSN